MKIPYYPGCTLNTVSRDFDLTARRCAGVLGVEMEELRKWNCCGASFPLTPDNTMGLAGAMKVLAEVKKEGDRVTTLCSVCYNVLKRTNRVVRDDREKRRILNEFLEEDYDGSVEVRHFLEVLRDEVGFERIKEKVCRPLKGVRIGAYYGCMLLRPFEDMGIDDAESPRVIEDLFSALGAEPVEFPNRVECCGAHLGMWREDVVVRLSGSVMTSAVERGAELIVTSCPLCQYNLERSQKKVVQETPGYREVPVVYFTQLLGLALGQDERNLGFERNLWDVRPLLREKGIL